MDVATIPQDTCLSCNNTVSGSALQALGHTYHPECFRCTMCSAPLRTSFTLRDGTHPTCAQCTEKAVLNFGGIPDTTLSAKLATRSTSYSSYPLPPTPESKKELGNARAQLAMLTGLDGSLNTSARLTDVCARCETPVDNIGIVLETDKNTIFHESCFFCEGCGKTLVDKSFCARNGVYYHPSCFQERFCDRCTRCLQLIVNGKYVDYEGRKMHANCFLCTHCQAPLATSTFTESNNLPYCMSCADKKCYISVDDKIEKMSQPNVPNENHTPSEIVDVSNDPISLRSLPPSSASVTSSRTASMTATSLHMEMQPTMSPSMDRLIERHGTGSVSSTSPSKIASLTCHSQMQSASIPIDLAKDEKICSINDAHLGPQQSVPFSSIGAITSPQPFYSLDRMQNTETRHQAEIPLLGGNNSIKPYSMWRGDTSIQSSASHVGTKDRCVGCGEKIFEERKQGPLATMWHAKCLTCHSCGKPVDSFALYDATTQQPTCRTCHLTRSTRDKPKVAMY